MGPISMGSSSSRRAVAARVAASVVAYGRVAERVGIDDGVHCGREDRDREVDAAERIVV